MRIYGKLIKISKGHTADSPALVNRVIEVYYTKTHLKVYLFNSSCKGWHRKENVITMVKSKPETWQDACLTDVVIYLIYTLSNAYGIKF